MTDRAVASRLAGFISARDLPMSEYGRMGTGSMVKRLVYLASPGMPRGGGDLSKVREVLVSRGLV
jgi:hypothetical protein